MALNNFFHVSPESTYVMIVETQKCFRGKEISNEFHEGKNGTLNAFIENEVHLKNYFASP